MFAHEEELSSSNKYDAKNCQKLYQKVSNDIEPLIKNEDRGALAVFSY